MSPTPAARTLLDRIGDELRTRPRPLIVALDGRSGAGKSTLAAEVAALGPRELAQGSDPMPTVSVIAGDDFYAGGSAATWDERSAPQKAAGVIDWPRQRDVLATLRTGRDAEWHPFDWDADDWDADVVPRRGEPAHCPASDVVLLEGAYSARPELSDLVDLRVLLRLGDDVRRARLIAREGEAYHDDWSRRWSEAEAQYFGTIMPPERFDLVLDP